MTKPKTGNRKFESLHVKSRGDRNFTQEKTMEQIVEGIVTRLFDERFFDPY